MAMKARALSATDSSLPRCRTSPASVIRASTFFPVEAGELADVEAGESLPVALPLLQHGDPGESGLRAFEDELFEELTVVAYRHAPFFVVVGDVERVVSAPEAAWLRAGHVSL
jgi:hypothetical protein